MTQSGTTEATTKFNAAPLVADCHALARRYRRIRSFTESLCKPLVTEDYVVQTMPDVSPTKWHLAHSTWFFEALVLAKADKGYSWWQEQYKYLFNSYYNSIGPHFDRPRRGVLSRPTVEDIFNYREEIDARLVELLNRIDSASPLLPVITLGLHHEMQHQELLLTDIKHVFASNPLRPIYCEQLSRATTTQLPLNWKAYDAGLVRVGYAGSGFAHDNELPNHQVFVPPFSLATRLVTNGEYLSFILDRGYERPELWLSDGWVAKTSQNWTAPLYWQQQGDQWQYMTLGGLRGVDASAPVCHVSFYEADAYARWARFKIPREEAWELAASDLSIEGNFAESGNYHPVPAKEQTGPDALCQMFGDLWEWTSSPYVDYPGYQPPSGPLGEYNAKFMCNQMVLRGGSCATPQSHIRPTYRNFFPPDTRWQFSGIRLANPL